MNDHAVLTWTRFEKWGYYDDPDDEEAEFVEIARDGYVVHVRRGPLGRPGKVKSTPMASDAAAVASVDRRIKNLERGGWLRADSVTRGVSAGRKGPSLSLQQRFASGKAEFFEELKTRGIDAHSSFSEQGAKRKVSWNEIAADCLEAASRAFGVSFTGFYLDESEHDADVFPIPEDRLAEFYGSPSRIIQMAWHKLAGRLTEHDGRWDDPGS